MSVKNLFHKNKQAITVGKYLRTSAPNTLGDGIESEAHLESALSKSSYFVPDVDYGDPENFVKFGSAKEYYKNAFSYIANYYPYDGSFLEKTNFYNNIAPIEKYVLEEIYPRSTGFIVNGANYGAITPDASGYYSSSVEQFVRVKGGPHSGSIYSESQGRTSNLEFGGPSGSTVEFFFKKNSVIDKDRSSERQVILDVWNGAPIADSSYGRLRIEITSGSSGEDRFLVTLRSGSSGFVTASVPATGNMTLSDGKWRNFGFVFNTSGSNPTVDFYTNGSCVETVATGSGVIAAVTGTMIGTIGALRTDVETAPGVGEGYGKLSASLDEFRFWKTARNAQQIGRWWFDDVGGGSNKYDANVSLGVYYKFNEGITHTASVDQVILDYSGRLSNGKYIGYSTTDSRNTGSAIDQLSLTSIKETPDPIVRTSNPLYTSLYTTYVNTGSYYDGLNSARLLNHLPAWIIEAEEEGSNEIVSLTQIIASYFDTIYNQLTALKNLKHMSYNSGSLSASMNEFPFNDRLVESMGLETPEIFANIGTLQQFLKRDEQIVFDQNLTDIKNAIYKNIYNNINFILKSKGNEKSIRNFIRCLGVDEEIITLNAYSNNSDFKLASSYKTDVSEKKYVDFSALQYVGDAEANVYQYYDSTNVNSVGVITGSSNLEDFAFSLQSEVIFPNKQNYALLSYSLPSAISSSLFGFHTPATTNPTSTDLTWATALSDFGLQVYAVKSPGEYPAVYEPGDRVMDAFFVVKNRAGTTLLTSSIFNNVYDNQRWNFTLSLRPKKYPFNDGVLGAVTADEGYILQLYGVNCNNGVVKNKFSVEESVAYATGEAIVESTKRIYAGAHRTDYTGGVLTNADTRISSVRYWTDYLPTGSLLLQAQEVDSYGRLNPYRNAYSFQDSAPSRYIPKIQTLALNWDFADITGSNASGRFTVADFSSGSSTANYESTYQDTMLSAINLRQHTGRGDFFSATATPVRKEFVYTNKLQGPEYISSEDMIRVMSSDDETFGVNIRPENFYFAVERSLYRSISNRMLHLFASIEEFNNLIGEPVNKYRYNYKRMEKLREIFFRKVDNDTIDLDKYVKYYKWLDDAMSDMIEQLLPGSARYAPNVRKMVESHVLERPKIKYDFPLLDEKTTFGEGEQGPQGTLGGPQPPDGLEGDPHDPSTYPPITPPGTPIIPRFDAPLPNIEIIDTVIPPGGGGGFGGGIDPRVTTFGWRYNHAPVDGFQSTNGTWWKLKAERYNNVLSGPGGLLYGRQTIQKMYQRQVGAEKAVRLNTEFSPDYGPGVNQRKNKKHRIRDLTFDAFQPQVDINDEPVPDQKKRVDFRATKDGVSYNGEQITPFSAISGTITAGYNAVLASAGLPNVDITNLHQDNVRMEGGSFPLQGPFPRRYVGGVQARHAAAFKTADRKEEYTLSISSGTGSLSTIIIGDTPKGQYLRGYGAKRPLNIRNIQTRVTGSTVAMGVREIGNYQLNYEVVQSNNRSDTNIDFIFNTSDYDFSMPTAFVTTPAMRVNEVTGSADYPAPRQRQATAAFAIDALKITGGTVWHNDAFTVLVPTAAGGLGITATVIARNAMGSTPSANQIHWYLDPASDAAKIANLKLAINGTSDTARVKFGSGITDGATVGIKGLTASDGVTTTDSFATLTATNAGTAGNDIAITDTVGTVLVNESALTHGKLAGGKAGTRTNQSIFVNQFAAPGSKLDSKQQFRDVNSDQFSPNNALPFRNIPVRASYNTKLRAHTLFGGYQYGDPTVPSVHQAPSNPTRRLQILGTYPTETYMTGTFYDNAFVTRPIPAGDSTQWFMSLSGSDTNTYSLYVLSGSRYPANITETPVTFPTVTPVAADGSILVTNDSGATWHGRTIIITDASGNTVTYGADNTVDLNSSARLSPILYIFGVKSSSATSDIAESLYFAILSSVPAGGLYSDLMVTLSMSTPSTVALVQINPGTAGNNTMAGTAGGAVCTNTGMAGGINSFQYYFGPSALTGTDGNIEFIWGDQPQVAPWTQLREGSTNQGSYFWRNNIYEILPREIEREVRVGTNDSLIEVQYAGGTSTRQTTDRGGNTLSYYYSQRFKEAPLTSRYKPMQHTIVTPLGNPSRTGDDTTTVAVEYSYGNSLMGFAHRELNRTIQGRLKFAHGEIKRPYEILREQRISNVPSYVNGVNLIRAFEYPETIYPREIYTYLSGTRARLSYVNSFWRDDATLNLAAAPVFTYYGGLRAPAIVAAYNKQLPRMQGNFVTSQGYSIEAEEQNPYNTLDPSFPKATGYGSASMWPLDSYLFSDANGLLATILTSSTPVVLADAATMACGELLMTHYGTIDDGITNPSYTNSTASYQTASVNSAQYVYNVPVTRLVTTAHSAVTASAAITASTYQGAGLAAATGSLVVGATATRSTLGFTEVVQIADLVQTATFEFDDTTTGFSFNAPTYTYTVGLAGSSGGTTEQIRDSLYSAVADSTTSPSSPMNIIVNKHASAVNEVQLTASVAGTLMNLELITSAVGPSSGIQAETWYGGTDADFNGKKLILDDGVNPAHTMSFDKSVNVAASTDVIIGVQDATSAVNDVATAIGISVAAAEVVGAIDISVNGAPAGGIVELNANTPGTAINGRVITGSAVADAGYISTDPFAGGKAASTETDELPEPRSPGAAYTRPPWGAGQYRLLVDGPGKGSSAGSVYPFYNSYDDYCQNIRRVAKDHTIIPEFRISEHVAEYQTNGSLFSIISGTLEITGANASNYDGTNTAFYERFALTDTPEFVEDLMPLDTQNRNFIFNNYPRHFEISSDAIAKLLPYEGFYPVERTLDIAKSFYDSYYSAAVFEGDAAATPPAWRSLYKPFVAPGILYNSIKSGLSVDYPIRRATRNEGEFLSTSAQTPLKGALSGALSTAITPLGTIPGNSRRQTENLDWSDVDVNKFFWADRLPFEAIMDPASFVEQGYDEPVILADINEYLFYDASGSISTKTLDDSLYKKMVSNFLANVPRFFLKKKFNKFGSEGYMSKFVSQFGSPPKQSQETSSPQRTVKVDSKSAYMMEVGLLKTDRFSLYSNPYAFGIPTATGSVGWSGLTANELPSGSDWPYHRGEFAPFTPPYYYGPSIVRILFVPSSAKEDYTLDEIVNNNQGELFVQYLNESGSYFDAASGSYVDRDGNDTTTTGTPSYGWNRAWQNRMDIDASISVENKFPLGAGGQYVSSDPNKWTIMPKWEVPILDFPDRSRGDVSYDFSSSVTPSEYTASAAGMWHQYGVMPNDNEGVYLYIKDVPTGKDEEYDRIAICDSASTINYKYVSKVPKFIIDADRQVRSLADLCGFDPDEIIRKGFDYSKAKRLGELAENSEKSLSEAILAIPVYRDDKQNIRLITLRGHADLLGPKIKEFRKKFTKYSLPPVLAHQLRGLVPRGYPNISDVINPFGPDNYDSILDGNEITRIPVVYLMEHAIELHRQDLADMWQGIMPDIATSFKQSFAAIDHYMPGDNVEVTPTKFPEVLKKQIELDVERTGHPRYDLLDIAAQGTPEGFFPEIKWLVFKVKERGLVDYSHMVMEEVDGPGALGYDNLRPFFAQAGLSAEQLSVLDQAKDAFAENSYLLKHAIANPTYNWPYDYFSLLELAKINTKIGFRPDLSEEYSNADETQNNLQMINLNIPQGDTRSLTTGEPLTISLLASTNNDEET